MMVLTDPRLPANNNHLSEGQRNNHTTVLRTELIVRSQTPASVVLSDVKNGHLTKTRL